MIIILIAVLNPEEQDFINKLYQDHNEYFYKLSKRIVISEIDAEEAVAQAFLNIIDNIEKISKLPCPEILPYCVIIVKNVSLDIVRYRKRSLKTEEKLSIEEEDDSDELWNFANKDVLLSAMNLLNDDERQFIQLRFAKDLSYRDIAQILGSNEEAIKKRSQRILKKLRSFYRKECEGFEYV